jgi:hypothetical protein
VATVILGPATVRATRRVVLVSGVLGMRPASVVVWAALAVVAVSAAAVCAVAAAGAASAVTVAPVCAVAAEEASGVAVVEVSAAVEVSTVAAADDASPSLCAGAGAANCFLPQARASDTRTSASAPPALRR